MDILNLTPITSLFILILIKKRRWTKETNCGDANKWLVCLRLVILYAAYGHCVIREDGNYYEHPHWFELAKDK